jgi:hypothetical protein
VRVVTVSLVSVWLLCVETATREHRIPIGPDEAAALRALEAARDQMQLRDVVTIAQRLALDGRTIRSIWIEKQQPG